MKASNLLAVVSGLLGNVRADEMPSSVAYIPLDGGRHKYVISGVDTDVGPRGPDAPGKIDVLTIASVPDAIEATIDLERGTFEVVFDKRHSPESLKQVVDRLALLGGIPYWSELKRRDTPKQAHYRDNAYELRAIAIEPFKKLAWFAIQRDRELKLPLRIQGGVGALIVTPSSAHCIAHSKFTLRIINEQEELVWQDLEMAFAEVQVALMDGNQDGFHEVLLERDDHGTRTSFIIDPSVEQDASDQPATRPLSK